MCRSPVGLGGNRVAIVIVYLKNIGYLRTGIVVGNEPFCCHKNGLCEIDTRLVSDQISSDTLESNKFFWRKS